MNLRGVVSVRGYGVMRTTAVVALGAMAAAGAAHASWYLPAELQAGPRYAQARGPQPIPMSRTYEDVRKFMQDIVVAYPRTARLFKLGDSDSGRPIEGLMLGDLPVIQRRIQSRQAVVSNLVVGTHHGNEYGSTEVAKAFMLSMAQAPIQGQLMYVVPVLNIPGFDVRQRRESAGGRTFDPNRDYPGPCGTDGPFKLKSTAALAKFVQAAGIVASATLHTFSPAILYPWGISTKDLDTPYTDLFKVLGQAATVESKYPVGNSTALLYAADGTFEDYAFWQHGVWSMLFEMGGSHSPSPQAVYKMQLENVPGLRRMFEQTPRQKAELHAFTGKCDTFADRQRQPRRRDE